MRVIITAATNGEWMPSFQKINPAYAGTNKRFSVGFHESGIGLLASSVSLMKMFVQETPSLIIQVGIAGCFDKKVPLGKVFAVKDDFAGDIGVIENKVWKDLFDLKLDKANDAPYEKKSLPNPWLSQYNLLKLPTKKGVTVNTISTDKKRRRRSVTALGHYQLLRSYQHGYVVWWLAYRQDHGPENYQTQTGRWILRRDWWSDHVVSCDRARYSGVNNPYDYRRYCGGGLFAKNVGGTLGGSR